MSYTNGLDKPSDYFNTKLYTGTGSSLGVTGVGFQPDLVWIKGRSGATEHVLTDSVRGVTEELSSNDSGAEETVAQGLTAFNSDGFTVGTDGSYNTSSSTYVSWSWLAGGTASSNTDGSITSTVSANTTSGFSIVKYTGTGSVATVGTGLNAVPNCMLVKNIQNGSKIWLVYHSGNTSEPETEYLALSFTSATTDFAGYWNDTAPTSSVFTLGTGTDSNNSGEDYIAYLWSEKKGFSKFGSYTGNGNADGTFIYTGFKPAWVMVKRTDTANSWNMLDNKRDPFNDSTESNLFADLSNAENTIYKEIEFVSNGMKVRSSGTGTNASGGTYIYMAFASNPFVTSTSIPCTAR